MTRAEVYERLNEVFRDMFDDETITVNDQTTSEDIEGWDSLEYINLVLAVEREFSVRLNIGEVNKIKNVGEMVDIILRQLG